MNLYHVTSAAAAQSILEGGFRDGEPTNLTSEDLQGVWLTDDPQAVEGSGACRAQGVFLRLGLGAQPTELDAFELLEEDLEGEPVVGMNYREWLIPAEWLRGHIIKLELVENDDDLAEVLKSERRPRPPCPTDWEIPPLLKPEK